MARLVHSRRAASTLNEDAITYLYGYDPVGRIVVDSILRGNAHTGDQDTLTYLTRERFAYDDNSNITKLVRGTSTTTNYCYASGTNQLTSHPATSCPGTTFYTYDLNGNMTQNFGWTQEWN